MRYFFYSVMVSAFLLFPFDAVVYSADEADLIVQLGTVDPTQALPGENIEVSVVVMNVGDATAYDFEIGYLYSNSDTCSLSADTVLDTDFVGSLGAGDFEQLSDTFYLQNDLSEGIHYICFYADYTKDVDESNESNNKILVPIEILGDQDKPDLVINSAIVDPVHVLPGHDIDVAVTVKNIGGSDAGGSEVGYYYSSGSLCSTSDTYLDEAYIGSLDVNETKSDERTLYIPENINGGTDYICFIADVFENVDEGDEGNNRLGLPIDIIDIDDFEPDNIALDAYDIGTASSYTSNGRTLLLEDKDFFSFTYDEKTYYVEVKGRYDTVFGKYGIQYTKQQHDGDQVDIEIVSVDGSDMDTYLTLYDSDHETILAKDDNSGMNDFSHIVFHLPPNGDAYEPDNTYQEAHDIGTANGYTSYGRTLTLGDKDWIKFSYDGYPYYLVVRGDNTGTISGKYGLTITRQGGEVDIETHSVAQSITDTFLKLYGPGPEDFLADDDNSGEGEFSHLTLNLPEEGSDFDGDTVIFEEEVFIGTDPNDLDDAVSTATSEAKLQAMATDVSLGNYGGDPVNIRTGGFEFTKTDFLLPGRGFEIDYSRTYNSRVSSRNGRLGKGWSSSYNMYYYQDPVTKHVNVYHGGSLMTQFTTNDDGQTFQAPRGVADILIKEGNTMRYQTVHGDTYIFSEQLTNNLSVLKEIIDTNENKTELTYTYAHNIPLLTQVTDPSGRSISFTYGETTDLQLWDNVVEMRDNVNVLNSRIVTYTYDDEDLVSVTSNRYYDGATELIEEHYTYDADGKMLTYTDPRGTILRNVYDIDGKVIEQYEHNPRIDAPGTDRRIYVYLYEDDNLNAPGSVHCTVVRAYRNDNTFYSERSCFDIHEQKIYKADGEGNAERWAYNEDGMVEVYTDKNGNSTTYTYYDQTRLVWMEESPVVDGVFRRIDYSYDSTFNKVTSIRDELVQINDPGGALSARITWRTLDSNNGNVLEEMDGLGESTIYEYDVYGNIIKKIDRNGHVTEYWYGEQDNGNYITGTIEHVEYPDGSKQSATWVYTYDQYGNKSDSISPKGAHVVREYDTRSNIRKNYDPYGYTQEYFYDLEDHLIFETNENGTVTNYVYDTDIQASLLLVERVGVEENIIESRSYDYVGNVISETNPLGYEVQYAYDGANRIVQKIEPELVTNYLYDGYGNLTEESNDAGQRSTYTYDALHRQITQTHYYTDADSITTYTVYDGFSRLTTSTDGNGNVRTYTYDLLDRVLFEADPLGTVTSYTYDAEGNRISVLLPRAQSDVALRNQHGDSVTYLYDSSGRLVRETNALDKQTLYTYDKNGNIVAVLDRQNTDDTEAEHVTQYEYDLLDRKTKEIDPLGGEVSFTYDGFGNMLSRTDEMNRTWMFFYDQFSRLKNETDPNDAQTDYTYDDAGNRTSVKYPDGTTTEYIYDAQSRPTIITDELGNTQQFFYDAVGNIIKEIDKRGVIQNYGYDKLRRRFAERNGQGTITQYSYDNNHNRVVQNVAGKVTSFVYDALDRVETITNPGGDTEQYLYDADGNVITKTDGEGQSIGYVYDALGRVVTKDLEEISDVVYTHDNWDNVTSISDEIGVTVYTYDSENKMLTEQKTFAELGQSYTITKSYHLDGQLQSVVDASGMLMEYMYDGRGLLSSVQNGNTDIATYSYTDRMQPQTLLYSNGFQTTYAYDELGRTQSIHIDDHTGAEVFSHTYSYDAENNRTSLVEGDYQTMLYTYDELEQLTGVDYSGIEGDGDVSFAYDAWGNRTSLVTPHGFTEYAYEETSDRLISTMVNDRLSTSYTYDANGSVIDTTVARHGVDVRTQSYDWDEQRRLKNIVYNDVSRPAYLSALPQNGVAYRYDDVGNRVKKIINNNQDTSRYYINDGLRVMNELDSTGVVQKTVVQGLGHIAEIDEHGEMTFVHQDALGSTILLSNEAGDVVAAYMYDVFGAIVGAEEEASGTNYLFTNQEYDSESDLYYYNARYYDPSVGRFISRDVVLGEDGDSLSRNRYVYVKNNPLKYVDPSGNSFKFFSKFNKAKKVFNTGKQIYKVGNEVDKTKDEVIQLIEREFDPGSKSNIEKNLSLNIFGYLFTSSDEVIPPDCSVCKEKEYYLENLKDIKKNHINSLENAQKKVLAFPKSTKKVYNEKTDSIKKNTVQIVDDVEKELIWKFTTPNFYNRVYQKSYSEAPEELVAYTFSAFLENESMPSSDG